MRLNLWWVLFGFWVSGAAVFLAVGAHMANDDREAERLPEWFLVLGGIFWPAMLVAHALIVRSEEKQMAGKLVKCAKCGREFKPLHTSQKKCPRCANG